jgi:glutaredoxin
VSEVVLVTKADCGLCEQAKDVLGRIAPEFRLEVREVGLESEEGKSLALQAAAPFPPVVFLDGEAFSYGRLSERRLRKALRR